MSTVEPIVRFKLPYYDESGEYSYSFFVKGLFKQQSHNENLMHAALGVCGEAGELGDAIKKHVVYGKPLDLLNVIEELGDLRFYMQALMNEFGISEEQVLQSNAVKLQARYKEGSYSDKAAQERADKVATAEYAQIQGVKYE